MSVYKRHLSILTFGFTDVKMKTEKLRTAKCLFCGVVITDGTATTSNFLRHIKKHQGVFEEFKRCQEERAEMRISNFIEKTLNVYGLSNVKSPKTTIENNEPHTVFVEEFMENVHNNNADEDNTNGESGENTIHSDCDGYKITPSNTAVNLKRLLSDKTFPCPVQKKWREQTVSERDECLNFSEFIAKQLRKFDETNRHILMNDIRQMMMKKTRAPSNETVRQSYPLILSTHNNESGCNSSFNPVINAQYGINIVKSECEDIEDHHREDQEDQDYFSENQHVQEATCSKTGDVRELSVKDKDHFSCFGEYVASKLRNCNKTRNEHAIAEHNINNILFNLEIGVYDKNNQCSS